MAMNTNFIDAFMQMRRKATLQGRPLSQAETAGVTEGMASSASERLARAKASEQADRQLDLSHQTMQLNQYNQDRMADIAAKMMRQEKYKNYATTGLIGAGTAYQMLKPAASVASTLAPSLSTLTAGASGYVPAGATQLGAAAPSYLKQISDIVSKWF